MSEVKPSASDFKGATGALRLFCGHCGTRSLKSLSLCSGCKTVQYCSKAHQTEHWQKHKRMCKGIKKLRSISDREENAIRNATPDFMTPANAFETDVGRFWGIHSTRDYMRARFGLANTVRQANSLKGVEEGLGHARDMLRLNRSDDLGIRRLVLPLMIQLDQDQECYDIIKWFQITCQREDYDWGDMEQPFLDVVNADVLEDLDYMPQKPGETHEISNLLLLKIKLLIDVVNVRLARTVLAAKAVPPELWIGIEQAIVRSPLSMHLIKRGSGALTATERKLVDHIKILGSILGEANSHVLQGLLDPDEWLTKEPGTNSPGSIEEMHLVLLFSFTAWWQTRGSLELLHSARSIAAKDPTNEMQGMMESSTFKPNKGSSRSEAQPLEHVSLKRIWGYIGWAAEDAGSLCVERPSDAHMTRLRQGMLEVEAEDKKLFGDDPADRDTD